MKSLQNKIRNLSPRSEFFLVVALCFGFFTVTSAVFLLRGLHEFRMTTPRVLRAIFTEGLLLTVAAWILHVRGWNFRTLGFRFTWRALFAGIPLFIVNLVLYWGAVLLVVWSYPAAREIKPIHMIPAASFGIMATFILVNSLFEESIVTGYVIAKLSEQGPALSITASALIRFAYHLYQGPIASLSILRLGLLYAAVFWRWRNLWPLMTAHSITNLLSFWAESHLTN